jgi:hypothetical protein
MVYVTRSVMAVCIYTERFEYQRNVLHLSAEGTIIIHTLKVRLP